MLASLPKLAGYLSVTLFVTLLSVVPGLILAALLAVWKDQGSRIVSGGYRIFISFIRSTPLLFVLVIFALHVAGYGAEILRGSLAAIQPGEKEAAASLGMTDAQIYRRIVLPQAFVLSIPPLVNEVISTLKGTALIFNVGIVDVMRQAELMGGNSQRYLELYVDVAILYGAMIFALTLLGRALEHHFRISEDTLTVIGGEYE